MDRRAFLKTLASLGVAAALPANLAVAETKEIDTAWEAASSAWDLFEVSEYRTLSYANFEEPKTRYEAYGFSSTGDVDISILESHYDLYEPIQDLYREYLLELDPTLDQSAIDEQVMENWFEWSSRATDKYQDSIETIIDNWLCEEPDWCNEWENFYKTGNAQGAAYDHFLRENLDMLDELGIVIIEGQCPGSSYFAAELHTDVDEANDIARRNGWTIRFVHEGVL